MKERFFLIGNFIQKKKKKKKGKNKNKLLVGVRRMRVC
jgi:hypothetical protein